MSLTPEDIQGKRFHDAFRGYNHEEVDGFLDLVASSFVAVTGELQTTRRQVVDLEEELEVVKQTEVMLKRTLLAAQRAADEALTEAKAEAERTLASAAEKAAETLAEAEEKAKAAAAGAAQKAAETIAGANYRAGEIVAEAHERLRSMEELTERLRGFDVEHRRRLRQFLEAQLRTLDELASLPVVSDGPRPLPGPAAAEAAAPGAVPQTPAAGTGDAGAAPAAEAEPPPPASPDPADPSPFLRRAAGESPSPWSRRAEGAPPPDKRPEAATGGPEGPPVRSAPGGTHPPGRKAVPDRPPFHDVQEAREGREKAQEEPGSSGPSVRELFWGKG